MGVLIVNTSIVMVYVKSRAESLGISASVIWQKEKGIFRFLEQ